jgi:hypothetical protein
MEGAPVLDKGFEDGAARVLTRIPRVAPAPRAGRVVSVDQGRIGSPQPDFEVAVAVKG